MPNILLVTATKIESATVLRLFEPVTGKTAEPKPIGERIYWNLGVVQDAHVYMVCCEMGSESLGASSQTVTEGIDAISPVAVIMVGIAFGVDETEQKIGDILVAKHLRFYGPEKIGKTARIPRGTRADCSPWLLDRIKSADLSWKGAASVRFGVMVSGEKLINNLRFRQQILKIEPEAIGGEMEGAGLYAACQKARKDWILVKAICDWGHNKDAKSKDEYQQTAAENAVAFVLHAVQFTHWDSSEPVPAAAPAASAKPAHSSLPVQPFFFGREKELAFIADAIRPESRTWGALIDGPGGIGKTALAVRAGHLASAVQYPRKVFLSAKVRELTPKGEEPHEDFMLPNYLALLTELAQEMGQPDLARLPENERANAVRRALASERALFIIDNLETFPEHERVRLYQFLSLLPHGCKAIVTSRRRTDVDARIVRLERLEQKYALDLIASLANTNRYLAQATAAQKLMLYEETGGNPLLLRWTAGQLGRKGSQCRTVAEACVFLKGAPEGNDPLEYIFGDLLDTFSASETAVLAALTHFTQPAKVKWIADIAKLSERQAQTALEDLGDRALLESDPESKTFFLPPLAAKFLRDKRPEAVQQTGDRLADSVYALALENGCNNHDRFPVLEAEWPRVAAALPRLTAGENARLQMLCGALDTFLDFAGRWDDELALSQRGEEKALSTSDFDNAGWRAYQAGWVHYRRNQKVEVSACADRAQAHWKQANAGVLAQTRAMQLRGNGHLLAQDYATALADFRQARALIQSVDPEDQHAAVYAIDLGYAEAHAGDFEAADRSYREAQRIAKKLGRPELMALCTGALAALATYLENWPEAERLSREALPLAKGIGRQELIAENSLRLAKALSKQGRRAEGRPFAQEAVVIYVKLGMNQELEPAREALRQCEQGD